MIKAEQVIDKTYNNLNQEISKEKLRKIVKAYYDAIEYYLSSGEELSLDKFVHMRVVDVPERRGYRVFSDGSMWIKPAHKEIRPKAGSRLKSINPE